MSPAEALADLTDLSTQVRVAVSPGETAGSSASTLGDDERSKQIASAARAVLEAAARLRAHGDAQVRALEASLGDGSLFVASEDLAS